MTTAESDLPVATKPALVFHYDRPTVPEDMRRSVRWLGRTSHAYACIHTLGNGGEITLHSHDQIDGYWMVLEGRVRFYTTGDRLIGEFGPMEGVVVPEHFPYWFEAVGDEEVQLLQFESSHVELRPGMSTRAAGSTPLPENSRATIDRADCYVEFH